MNARKHEAVYTHIYTLGNLIENKKGLKVLLSMIKNER